MPHLSQKRPSAEILSQLEELLSELVEETTIKERRDIMNELLTKTEQLMLAKRLGIILFLSKGFRTRQVAELLRMSPSTVARFQLGFEIQKYKKATRWFKKPGRNSKIYRALDSIASFVLLNKRKSFKQMLDDF